MEISKLFEKFNIPEKFNGNRLSPFVDKVFTILVTISFIFPIIYIIFNNSSYSIIGSIMTYLIGVLILFIVSSVITTILSSITPKYNFDNDFFPNKELLIQDKKNILHHISELSNISSIYPYLTLNLVSIAKTDEKNRYINQEAISLLKEISALIKDKKIIPDLNNTNIESILNHYKDFFLMSESNREILELELESGEVFPKLSEVLDFIKKQDLNFSDFLFVRNKIFSCNSLLNLFYENFLLLELQKNRITYLKENLEEYKNYINLIAEVRDEDGNIQLLNEMSYAIEAIYTILNEYPDFLKTSDLISLYTYKVYYRDLELIFEDKRFNFHDKAELSFSFFWDYDSIIEVRNLIIKCQNINTLNQLISNNKVQKEFYLLTAIISHALMKNNDYSKWLNSLINANWDNYNALQYLVTDKLSQDLGENVYRQVQSRITELKRDEKLLQNSEEVKNSQIRTEQLVEEQAKYARQQAESQRRQEEYQRIQAQNSELAARNAQIAAQNSQQAQRDAQQARRNTERRNVNPFDI
ncbi:hypothetical protein OZY38_00885 [Aliarcobacter cryaerophilus]|uniref:hypothetical protein n=1 Tax=Aliarcobacter cryaerophilus TaxID=28198 RepID=UPI003BB00439